MLPISSLKSSNPSTETNRIIIQFLSGTQQLSYRTIGRTFAGANDFFFFFWFNNQSANFACVRACRIFFFHIII